MPVTILLKNGSSFTEALSEIEASFATDNYDRREINVRGNGRKTRFKEIPGMLDEEEWEAIIAILSPKISLLGKLNNIGRAVKDEMKD